MDWTRHVSLALGTWQLLRALPRPADATYLMWQSQTQLDLDDGELEDLAENFSTPTDLV